MSLSKRTTCLLIDDEPVARRIIDRYLQKMQGFEVVGNFDNAIDALSALQSNSIDLVFLDIEMPELNGLDFLRSLLHKPAVIIVSAYREYAQDGFDMDVVDYLLKPVSFDRFLQALEKYHRRQKNTQVQTPAITENIPEQSPAYLQIRSERKMLRINSNELQYIESRGDYAFFFTTEGELSARVTLTQIEKKLPPFFMRIHRSFIVNTQYIHTYSTEEIEIDGKTLPVSRTYKQDVLQRLTV